MGHVVFVPHCASKFIDRLVSKAAVKVGWSYKQLELNDLPVPHSKMGLGGGRGGRGVRVDGYSLSLRVDVNQHAIFALFFGV